MSLFAHHDKTQARSNWLLISGMLSLAAALGVVVWICVGNLQENSEQMHKYQVKSELASIGGKEATAMTQKLFFPNRSAADPQDREAHKQSAKLLDQARALIKGHEYAKAITHFDQFIKLYNEEKSRSKADPDDKRVLSIAYHARGFCFLQMEQYQKAVDDLTRAMQLRPDFEPDYRNRAMAYRKLKKFDLAKLDHLKAAQLQRSPPKPKTAVMFEEMYSDNAP